MVNPSFFVPTVMLPKKIAFCLLVLESVTTINTLDHVSWAHTCLEQECKDAEDELVCLQEKMAEKISKLQRGLELLKFGEE
ncbi:uncharacterized protein F4822DRAFT_423015 [Hypoxylon trugodes]|uniref:uncharacterized protein n=1 Tax=Hypoxylon trugodes TaxID=326681 RepID=UPI002195810F|nr:uncharacterized protein F4822DRAFT_423015 [Hypoxylon trugodes]KAI1382609.1 hypothetical protein F4822DRAFT_423015 [Hypoxylon trugodes]